MKRLLMLVLVALALPGAAFAAVTTGGNTTIAGGNATLVSDSTHAYSALNLDDLNGQAPAALTSLSANVVSGSGWGVGSPRFEIGVKTSGGTEKNIFVYLGDAPNFTTGNTGNTGNLLASPDLRVDSSQIGGTFYDTWAGALAAAQAGGYNQITGISLVVDGGWSAPQTFVFNSVSINGTVYFPTCTTVHSSVGNLTAAVVDPSTPFSGSLPVSGCQIGVYFDQAGSVKNADIAGATYYGVFADKGAQVDVTDSHIHQIGNVPFDGMQNGRAVFYANGATGTVSGNQIDNYQKNGVVATDLNTSVSVVNNTITGRGPLGDIAQNGVVVIYGATALIKGNTVSGNWYTPKSYVACGLLFLNATGVKQQANSFSANEQDLCNYGRGGGNASA
jgi:hypothetical protein